MGILLELWLGVSVGSKFEQDFVVLGVEFKMIFIDSWGCLLEIIFVCVVLLIGNSGVIWESSYVWYKLQCVLWILVEGECIILLVVWCVGVLLLWSLDEDEECQLCMDWEELMDFIVFGEVECIIVCYGEVLQLRLKVVNSKVLIEVIGVCGEIIFMLLCGFYLKKNFIVVLFVCYFLL